MNEIKKTEAQGDRKETNENFLEVMKLYEKVKKERRKKKEDKYIEER